MCVCARVPVCQGTPHPGTRPVGGRGRCPCSGRAPRRNWPVPCVCRGADAVPATAAPLAAAPTEPQHRCGSGHSGELGSAGRRLLSPFGGRGGTGNGSRARYCHPGDPAAVTRAPTGARRAARRPGGGRGPYPWGRHRATPEAIPDHRRTWSAAAGFDGPFPETRGPRARGRGPDPRDASSMGPPSTARAARCRRSPRVRRDRSDRSVRRSSTRWCVRAATYGIEVSCEAPPYIDAPALVRTHQRQLTGTCKLFVMPRNGTREASGSLFTT